MRSVTDSPAAPNSAAERLLPVEVMPATRPISAELEHAEGRRVLPVAAEIYPAAAAAPHQLPRAALAPLLDPVHQEIEADRASRPRAPLRQREAEREGVPLRRRAPGAAHHVGGSGRAAHGPHPDAPVL